MFVKSLTTFDNNSINCVLTNCPNGIRRPIKLQWSDVLYYSGIVMVRGLPKRLTCEL